MNKKYLNWLFNGIGLVVLLVAVAVYESGWSAPGFWGMVLLGFFGPRTIMVGFRLFMMWREGKLSHHMDMATLQFSAIKAARKEQKKDSEEKE